MMTICPCFPVLLHDASGLLRVGDANHYPLPPYRTAAAKMRDSTDVALAAPLPAPAGHVSHNAEWSIGPGGRSSLPVDHDGAV
jgi:hypothetical protein